MEVNKYAHQRELAFEGRKVPTQRGEKKEFTVPSYSDYLKFRQNDTISHFINRLAYCRNEELRKWFLH
jgi:hypothetical protein